MHRDVAQNVQIGGFTFSLEKSPVFAVVMNVAVDWASHASESSDDDFLANLVGHVFPDVPQSLTSNFRSRLSQQFFGSCCSRTVQQLIGTLASKRSKFIAGCNRCRLALNFDHRSFAAVFLDGKLNEPFSRLVIGAFNLNLLELLSEDFNGLCFVAVGFHECLLAIHHREGCFFTQRLDGGGCYCSHVEFPFAGCLLKDGECRSEQNPFRYSSTGMSNENSRRR